MSAHSNFHILCIEDEPEMIDLIRLILGRRGFQVEGADGGKEGIEKIHNSPLIVSDNSRIIHYNQLK